MKCKQSIGGHGRAPSKFNDPVGIAVGNCFNIFATDTGNHRVQVFQSDGTLLTSFGEYGDSDGQMDRPHGVVVTSSGAVFVHDNGRIQQFQF